MNVVLNKYGKRVNAIYYNFVGFGFFSHRLEDLTPIPFDRLW